MTRRRLLDRLLRRRRPRGLRDALSLPPVENAVLQLTVALLFGGLLVAAVGTVWVAASTVGLPGTIVVGGLSATAYGLVLLVVLARAGLLDDGP